MNYWTQSDKNIYVAAHRGWCEEYPENTMEAFRAAIELGVDQIETDVRMTKDGVLVLIHDDLVERTINGTGKVSDMTFEELRALDAGIKKDAKFAGAKVPTLIELMELVKDHPTMTLDIELKEYPTNGREKIAYEVCDRVLKIVADYGFEDRFVINSFSGKLHDYIQKKYGNRYKHHVFYPVKFMGEHEIDPYSYAYCACMCASSPTTADFDFLRERGVRPWVGASVRNEKTVDDAVAFGAELITCNNPDVILDILRKKNLHK